MAIGNELRQSIVQAMQTHEVSQARLAQMLGVSVSSLKRIWQRWRQTGRSQLRPPAGGKKPKLTSQQQEQVRLVREIRGINGTRSGDNAPKLPAPTAPR